MMKLPSTASSSAANVLSAVETAPPLSDEFHDEEMERSGSSRGYIPAPTQRDSLISLQDFSEKRKSLDEMKELRDGVIKNEEWAVNKSRRMVAIAVILCAIAVSVTVCLLAQASDQHAFELEVS